MAEVLTGEVINPIVYVSPYFEGQFADADLAAGGVPAPEMPNPSAVNPETVSDLMALPGEGFRDEAHHEEIATMVAAVGFPIHNYRKLSFERNDKGRENIIGSWGIGSDNYGTFSVYEIYDKAIPEQKAQTIAHEGAHANTPFAIENAHLYGGEPERAEAAGRAIAMAEQALKSGKWLDGYQERLAKQLANGEIDFVTFAEESQAIAVEMAMTNRKGLEQKEAAQHAALARRHRGGLLTAEEAKPVNLISHVGADGTMAVDGIDLQVMALLEAGKGIATYEQYMQHIGGLKAHFYPPDTHAIATERFDGYLIDTAMQQHLAEVEAQARFEHRQHEEDEKQKRAAAATGHIGKTAVNFSAN